MCKKCQTPGDNLCSECEYELYTIQKKFFGFIKPCEQRRLDKIQEVLDSLGIRVNSYYANTISMEKMVKEGNLSQELHDRFWAEIQPINDTYFQETEEYLKKYQEDMAPFS